LFHGTIEGNPAAETRRVGESLPFKGQSSGETQMGFGYGSGFSEMWMWLVAPRQAGIAYMWFHRFNPALVLIGLLFTLIPIAGTWMVYVKAGRSGWLSLIPIVDQITLFQIAGKSGWWILLYCIPIVNFIVAIIAGMAIARRFGRSDLFGVGIGLLGGVFLPALGFSDSEYERTEIRD
jgi:hypothetical protein